MTRFFAGAGLAADSLHKRNLVPMEERTLSLLAEQIGQLHAQTQRAAAQQVNYWLTVRNWLIGWHIAEYEQGGSDRAEYGERLLAELARQLHGIKGLAERRLYQCREFYRAYPLILQTVSAELQRTGFWMRRSLSQWARRPWRAPSKHCRALHRSYC